LVSFCVYHRDTIFKELAGAKSAVKWLLDVTASSLNLLLIFWSRRAHNLRVVCDDSGPLSSMSSFFDVRIGREDKPSIRLGNREIHFGFNLAGTIAFRSSHDTPGIQLADVVSSTAARAMAERSDKWSQEAMDLLFESKSINAYSMLPAPGFIDLDHKEPQLNVMILLELLSRSEQGESLTNGLPEFIVEMRQRLAAESFSAED
jgi:hypothetical protein